VRGLGVVLGGFAWVYAACLWGVAAGLVGKYAAVAGCDAYAEVVCGGFDS